MHIVRYLDPHDDQVRVGILDQDEIRELGVSSVSELLHLSLAELQRYVDSVDGPAISSKEISFPPFVDGRTEVWAGGVTYARSRDARVERATTRRSMSASINRRGPRSSSSQLPGGS